jgi:predicted kinase
VTRQDTLGSLERCRRIAKQEIMAGNSVVIDATNKNAPLRGDWVRFLRDKAKAGPAMPVHCVWFDFDPKVVNEHLNCFRVSVSAWTLYLLFVGLTCVLSRRGSIRTPRRRTGGALRRRSSPGT